MHPLRPSDGNGASIRKKRWIGIFGTPSTKIP